MHRNRFTATLPPLPPTVITGPHGMIEVTVHPLLVSDDSADVLAPQVAAVIQAAGATADAVAVDTALSELVAGVPADGRVALGAPDDEPYSVPEGLPPGFGATGQVPAVVIESSTVPVRV